jgi:hypothetical protein
MEPIIKLARSIMEGNNELMTKMLAGINVELRQEEKKLLKENIYSKLLWLDGLMQLRLS